MRIMIRQLRPALVSLALFTVMCGALYPLVVTAIGQVAFPHRANGSLVTVNGTVVGSELLGQAFTGPQYFHPRPSAAVYDGGASSASNLGPLNADLLAQVEQRVSAYRAENGLADAQAVPVDAVTSSGSGLDPHISLANARLQATRVAAARGLAVDQVLAAVDDAVDGRMLVVLGEPGVNVLRLNVFLDGLRAP